MFLTNKSYIKRPLLSPHIYYKSVVSHEKDVIDKLKNKGTRYLSLINGNDTSSIIEEIFSTGTSLIMADYNSKVAIYKEQ